MQRRRGAAALLAVLLSLGAVSRSAAAVGWSHAVVIDAGSSGSRVHVYRYFTASAASPWARVELPEAVHRTSPGLASYAFEPRTAANSLQPLLRFAKDKVPPEAWASTPIQLLATAGLRRLSNGSAEAVLAEVRALLSTSGFDFAPGDARVLSGQDEGVWGWVATNYATGALQAATSVDVPPSASQLLLGRKGSLPPPAPPPSAPLRGLLELGGASLQVTFLPPVKPPPGQAAALALPRLGGERLYSRSFDGLGLQAAAATWAAALGARGARKDPCLPAGYVAGSGLAGGSDWPACRAGVRALLPLNRTCPFKRCGLNGTFLPATEGTTFVGLDNFWYTARALGLASGRAVSPDALEAAAKAACARPWSALRGVHARAVGGGQEPYVLRACFSAALQLGILEGLRLPRSAPCLLPSNAVVTPKGEAVEVSWALGAVIVEVLQLGGVAISEARIRLAAAGSGAGASDAVALIQRSPQPYVARYPAAARPRPQRAAPSRVQSSQRLGIMSAKDIIMGQVFPILGGVLATVMYCSPVKATFMARRAGALGDLNPFPFAVALVCTASWVAYGFASRDYNMFLANIPGFTATLYTTVTSHALATRKTQNMMMTMLLLSAPIILVLGVISAFVLSGNQAQLMWGFTCNAITIAYYGAPLSTVVQVIRSRSSASIYLPMCIANLVNTLLWIGYGFAVLDPFIYVPNAIGGVFAVVLCALCLIFPSKQAGDQALPQKGADAAHVELDVPVSPKGAAAHTTSKDAESQL
ncbi:APY5 [Scenedesmus sp. PABB004]|nr:APY5 [Scenedesmus sp. PABB004]